MKTDRELVDAAAKAAGIVGQPVLTFGGIPAIRRGNEFEPWSPLSNVGDAASLLLTLKMRVDYVGDQPSVDGVLQSGMTAEESFCRAAVRAAAARAA